MYLLQQVPQSYLYFFKSGKKLKLFLFSHPGHTLTETLVCRTLMSFFVLGVIFKRTGEAFSQTASHGKPVLPFPPFCDERKERVCIFLRKHI